MSAAKATGSGAAMPRSERLCKVLPKVMETAIRGVQDLDEQVRLESTTVLDGDDADRGGDVIPHSCIYFSFLLVSPYFLYFLTPFIGADPGSHSTTHTCDT